MKRDEIENKDQVLIKKIRTIIQNKEEKHEEETPPKPFPFKLIFLLTALIISSMLLVKHQGTIGFSKAPKPRAQFATIPPEQPGSKPDTVKKKAPSHAPRVLAPPRKMVDRDTILKSSGSELNTPVLEQTSPAEVSNQKVAGDMPLGILIEEIISCSRVDNRQYSRPKNLFSLARDTRSWIWMKVISENPPFTLTHVYYCNGQKYCEVPLAIRFHRMRTWSSITLRSPDHIGKWRVDVIDDSGVKLDQIEFTVVK